MADAALMAGKSVLVTGGTGGMKTPAQGAATPVYLASSPEAEGITGRYYANRKPRTSSKASYDTTAAARLWQVSAALAGLTATA